MSTGKGLIAFGFAAAGAVAVSSTAEAPAIADSRMETVLVKSVSPPDPSGYGAPVELVTPHSKIDWLARASKC
ncbi:hypothetical protein GCM10027089_49830 [Nocardia thraciensis]